MIDVNDEWNALADFLAGVIEKYAEKLDLDKLPDPDTYYKINTYKTIYKRYMRLSSKKRAS